MAEAVVRFEVLVNGRRVCLAGQAGDGCLNAQVQYCRLAPLRLLRPVTDYDGDNGGESLVLAVFAHDDAAGEMRWTHAPLAPGDEVTVRVLGPGPSEPAAEVTPPPGPDDLPF
ncbi:hypothetical protein [Gemmata obscuriglobus]|uniref:Uncharacterized protein n=1 Tax=Gemmata obscuriglobus TaxID=114 RepID=A0A2Z3H2Z3_9BACT|nr:hypothetical protein [Gemmata obscuriglobus]AWM40383.1 hypothetical protein C1280_27600 [Gemmata obscuriglobus]AWM40389.1 hypothetical protein C1280_27650 [Gemmata obscuriglobus]